MKQIPDCFNAIDPSWGGECYHPACRWHNQAEPMCNASDKDKDIAVLNRFNSDLDPSVLDFLQRRVYE